MAAGIFAYEPNLMITRRSQFADISIEIGYNDATLNIFMRIYIGHGMHKQMPIFHFNLIALLLEALDVRVKNDWFW